MANCCWMSDIGFTTQLIIYHDVYANYAHSLSKISFLSPLLFLLLICWCCCSIFLLLSFLLIRFVCLNCSKSAFNFLRNKTILVKSGVLQPQLRYVSHKKRCSDTVMHLFFFSFSANVYIDHVFDVILGTIDQHIILLL